MTSPLLEWKATLAGLLIAGVIVAALFARPAWGVSELAELAAGIGAVLLGAVSRIGAPTLPQATAVVAAAAKKNEAEK